MQLSFWVTTQKVCLAAAMLVMSQESASAQFAPTTGRIAYHNYTAYDIDASNPNGPTSLDGQIRLYDFSTDSVSTVGVIDRFVRHAINANYSPDGSKITFMGIPRGPDYDTDWSSSFDLFLYDFRAGKLVNLSAAAKLGATIDEDPSFGPGGTSVLFKRNRHEIWSIDLATLQTTQRLGHSGVERSAPRVSPDGLHVTYWSGDGTIADVSQRPIQPDGSFGAEELVAGVPRVQEYFPSYRDNSTVIYSRWPNASNHADDIYTVDLNTLSRTAAAFNLPAADDSDGFGMHQASTLGFSSNRPGGSGGWDLYLGDPTSKVPMRLSTDSTPKHDLGASYHATTASGLGLYDKLTIETSNAAPPADFDHDADGYEQYALRHKGDAAKGKLLFDDKRTKCATCHKVAGKGGDVGKDLSSIGGKFGGKVPAGHQGGALHFGPDGKLYIAIGEQTSGMPAQKLDTFLGKILRINSDGSIPSDNPLRSKTQGKYQAIWAYGCRNPFTFAFRKSDGLMLINDVGGKSEEVNVGRAGANYGWPVVQRVIDSYGVPCET